MRLSVESVFFFNFALDVLALVAALRSRVRLRPARLFTAGLFGALVGSYLAITEPADAVRVLSAIAAAPMMVRIASGGIGAQALIGASAALLAVSALMAALIGAVSGASLWAFFAAAALSALLAGAVMGLRRKSLNTWEANVSLHFRGARTCFRALVDTGNRLTEPLSGLPVMLVAHASIAALLPAEFDPAEPLTTLPRGFRMVGYGGVGGAGQLGCFMPDALHADTGRGFRRMGEIWIAVYPGRLPGSAKALAPPTFLSN